MVAPPVRPRRRRSRLTQPLAQPQEPRGVGVEDVAFLLRREEVGRIDALDREADGIGPRTELHALLGRAHDAAGEPDSAAAHYRAVLAAWRSADPQFLARRDSIRSRLAALERATPGTATDAER